MEQQNGNNMTNNVIDANFNIISHFLSSALRNVEFSDIIRSEGRTVFVSMAKETKQIVIPEKNTHIIEWKQAWLAVFENYLKALDDKVGSLFMNSKYIKEVGDYGVKVGNHPVIQIPNDYNSVAYANALEEIIKQHNKVQRAEMAKLHTKQMSPIIVNSTSVQIDNPEKIIANSSAYSNVNLQATMINSPSSVNVSNVAPTLQNLATTVSNVEHNNVKQMPNSKVVVDKHRVQTQRMPMPKKVNEERIVKEETESSLMTISKIPADLSIDKSDCRAVDNQRVMVTCTGVKHGDGLFRDNIEVLREKTENVQIESFISGMATNLEQATKEATKMLKMLNDCQVGKLVVYEMNNDFILNHEKKPEAIKECLLAAEKICDVLVNEGYRPLLCCDLQVSELIGMIVPDYHFKYPLIKCATVKQKDLIADEDIVYMNPSQDMDLIMINTSNLQEYIDYVPEMVKQGGTLSVAA